MNCILSQTLLDNVVIFYVIPALFNTVLFSICSLFTLKYLIVSYVILTTYLLNIYI